jgi:3-hydroxyacyl-[acyl-carrier-protein] dehydratase
MEATYTDVMRLLPHRYPFLLVDKVTDIVPFESAVGIKNITLNEHVFSGHFPNDPIFPGVMIVESMAQTAAVFAMVSTNEVAEKNSPRSVYFMTIDGVKFRKPVRPGDVLLLKVKKDQVRGNIWKFESEAYVCSDIVAEARFMAMIAG